MQLENDAKMEKDYMSLVKLHNGTKKYVNILKHELQKINEL